MTQYGVDTYGECTYGVDGSGTTLLWGLDIAWEAEGVFTGTNYARYMTSCQWSRGRSRYLGSNGEGIELPEVGSLTFELDNRDGIFDVTDTSGTLYPNVVPGKYARLRVRVGDAGTAYHVFTGIISAIEPVWGGVNPKVRVTVEDGWSLLNQNEVNLEYVVNCNSNAAVTKVLTAAKYPPLWGTSVQAGDYQIVHFMGAKNQPASQVIKDIINYEFGTVAVMSDGSFKFKKQTQTSSPAYTISQSHMLKDIQVYQNYNSIRNAAKFIVYPKWIFGQNLYGPDPKVIWTLDETPVVEAGEKYEVWGYFTYNDKDAVASYVSTITPTTDYSMTSVGSEGGLDVTGQFTVTVTAYADRAKFEVYNIGTMDAQIDLLQLRGGGYSSPDATFIEVDNSTTTKRTVVIDTPYHSQRSFATDQADYLLTITDEEILPRFQIEARPERQFEYDLLDEVTLDIPKYRINGSYFISHIEGEWLSENGQAVLSTFQVETAAEGGIS